MPDECPECGAEFGDEVVYGGSVTGFLGSLYVEGTSPCPECEVELAFEAKMCGGYPKKA